MDTQIKQLMRTMGGLQASVGLKVISTNADFETYQITLADILKSLKAIGVSSTDLDTAYYATSWDNWQKILDTIWGIVKNFKWVAEKFDCDNRSALASSLCGLLFGVNTCMQCYCEVYDNNTGVFKYLHWVNLVIDKDANLYLFDVDNGGLRQKIISNNPVMGNLKYKLISARIG